MCRYLPLWTNNNNYEVLTYKLNKIILRVKGQTAVNWHTIKFCLLLLLQPALSFVLSHHIYGRTQYIQHIITQRGGLHLFP